MMEIFQYSYKYFNGQIIVNVDGFNFFVDSGCPESFCCTGEINLAGRKFDVAGEYAGANSKYLSENVGLNIDGQLGCDILNSQDFAFSSVEGTESAGYRDGTMLVSDLEILVSKLENPVGINLDFFQGIPIFEGICLKSDAPEEPGNYVQSAAIRLFLDLGSRLSYVNPMIIENFDSAGEDEDFHITTGRYKTETYHAKINSGGLSFPVRAGILREISHQVLESANVIGIIGSEILKSFSILYSARRNRLFLGSTLKSVR